MATVVEIPDDVANLAGPLLLGYLLNFGLFGILTVQVYLYYTAFPNDNKVCQTLVYSIYALEIAQTVMITHDAFQNFVYGFGRMSALDELQVLWFDSAIVDGIVACAVQTYFAYRIYLLSRSKIIPCLAFAVALTQLGGALATGIEAKIVGRWSLVRGPTDVAAIFWLGGSAFGDVLTACAMTYVLSKNDHGFKDTQDIIRRIMRLTIETGALTAVIAFLDLILFLAYPDRAYHVVCALVLAKLYSNSLLALYNSRIQIPNSRGSRSTPRHNNRVMVTTNHEIVFRRPDDAEPPGAQIRVDVEEVSDTSSHQDRFGYGKRESGSDTASDMYPPKSAPRNPEAPCKLGPDVVCPHIWASTV